MAISCDRYVIAFTCTMDVAYKCDVELCMYDVETSISPTLDFVKSNVGLYNVQRWTLQKYSTELSKVQRWTFKSNVELRKVHTKVQRCSVNGYGGVGQRQRVMRFGIVSDEA